MRLRSMPTLALLTTLLYILGANALAEDPPKSKERPDYQKLGKPFVDKYCAKCHSEDDPQAELNLTRFKDSDALIRDRKIWMNALKQIQSGSMPPNDEPKPSTSDSEKFIEHVQAIFDHADKNAKPDPGRVTMRRLNRVEYKNTIRDLIGIDFDPTADFPSDDIGYGFDNIGDVLSLPPVLMERYLDAAESILQRAITPDPPPIPKRHLSSLYTEPASADVATKLIENNFRRLDSAGKEPIELGPLHTQYQWEPSGEYTFRTKLYGSTYDAAGNNSGNVQSVIILHGKDLPNPSSDQELDAISGNIPRPARILKVVEVSAKSPTDAQLVEVNIPPSANRDRVFVGQLKPAEGQSAKLFVEFLALDGPLDTRPESHRNLLAVSPNQPPQQQSREVLARFLRRAYRRPIPNDELERIALWCDQRLADGEKWESAMQLTMQAILCSPKFLFRVEPDEQPNAPESREIDPFALASRLSYFLWSSMPDDQLLNAAENGTLTQNPIAQVDRMLADPRSNALVKNFATQWLQIQRLESFSPDPKLFPNFNPKLKASMMRETELFFEAILRENRSALELINADFTFLDETLAKHYGIADTAGNWIGQTPSIPGGNPIQGDSFQRVSLQNKDRGGLITQASILTVTSNPTRTSPVKRGRWILEQILGNPPPPPPPNVPELPAGEQDASNAPLRKRMEIHRSNPACANCHAKMDPIGFALENYDPIGSFRTKDGPFDIDPSGDFADGTHFQGPSDLKAIIAEKKEEFLRCLIEKLMTYALGRGIEYYDRPVVEQIVASAPNNNYRFQDILRAIVQSEPFRKRRAPTLTP